MARRAIPTDASGLPDKPYFKIGEAARLCAVKPYVLRYWETEFKSVRPQKTRSQQRLYRKRDVELLLKIRHLLYEQRFTIEGARKLLEARSKARPRAVSKPPKPAARRRKQGELFDSAAERFAVVREELREILKILK